MKIEPLASTLVLLLGSCTHITMLGHKSAYDVNAEFSGDPIAPVSLNAGFEGRSYAAVPPKAAVFWWENFYPDRLPKGDAMSSLLELKIEKHPAIGPYSGVAVDYVTSGATGLAADAAAGASAQSVPALIENKDASNSATSDAERITERIHNITDSSIGVFD